MRRILLHQRLVVALAAVLFVGAVVALSGGAHGAEYWFSFWWMFPVAFSIALTVNTVGVSGAALFVPFFVLVFPLFAPALSALTSVRLGLMTEAFGLSSSALAFLSFGLVDLAIARRTTLLAAPFVVLGAVVSSFIPESAFFFMIAGLLMIAVILLTFEHALAAKRAREAGRARVDTSTENGERVSVTSSDGNTYTYCRTESGFRKRFFGYSVGGLFQGAGGFGVAEMGIVSMMLSEVPIRIAIGTNHLIVATTATLASLIHVGLSLSAHAALPWNILVMTVPAVVLGGQLAPHVAARLSTKNLERFISALFITLAVALIAVAFKKL